MDVAGTFFMTILIALQDKSVSFHFANNLDLGELEFFESISVICRHWNFKLNFSVRSVSFSFFRFFSVVFGPTLFLKAECRVELVSKELNHLAAILHVYAGGLNFMK